MARLKSKQRDEIPFPPPEPNSRMGKQLQKQKEERKKMPFINESLDNVHEPKPAPEGEYELRISKAIRKDSAKGNDMITVWINFTDHTLDAPSFPHYLIGWDSTTPEEQILNRKREWKRFCACFDLPEDCDEGDMPGQTGTSFVGQEAGSDDVVRNKLKLPRLKE